MTRALLTLAPQVGTVKSALDPTVNRRVVPGVYPVGMADQSPLDSAVTALLRAWADVVTALRQVEDPQAQFARATELGDVLRRLVSESTDERALAAERIADAESLSLTALGQRISMSKQRAAQLTDKAKKIREASNG